MQLGGLLIGTEVIRADDLSVQVKSLSYFADRVKPGGAYIACDLPWMAGYDNLKEAISRGASIIVVDRPVDIPTQKLHIVVVRDSKKAYSSMCANFFNNPHRRLNLYAVTGTKGKTTTCHILESIFKSAGLRTGLIGTIFRKIDGRVAPSSSTTPDPFELHWLLYTMWVAGVSHVVVEASSIGIAEERILGLQFDGMIFTNLGHEHLTYHGGIENYWSAKSRLFTEHVLTGHKQSTGAINVDDAFGSRLASIANGDVVTFGMRGDVYWTNLVVDEFGIRGEVCEIPIRSSLLGHHNAYNILGAIALSLKMGLSDESIAEGISSLATIPGRLERVNNEDSMDVFVDYAHTPESVEAILLTMRRVFNGRQLIVVLGCGGGSDRSKRSAMARASAENSSICIFTSDNPRHEDPMSIINDMLSGIDSQKLVTEKRLEVIVDRREAISRGVEFTGDGGVLVILGKGHERVQIIGNQVIPFDDREVASESLKSRRQAISSLT